MTAVPQRSRWTAGRICGVIAGAIGLAAAVITILGYLEGRHGRPPLPPPPPGPLTDLNTLDHIKKRRRLRVGYIPYYEMSSLEARSGELRGFLIDVLKKVTTDLSISEHSIEFVETDWQNFALGLNQGKYHLSIGGTFRTAARERVVSFTRPLAYLGNGALVRRNDSRFQSVQDLNRAGLRIAVIMGE
jgi:ABC-type amino acid transport substrate-binding protein